MKGRHKLVVQSAHLKYEMEFTRNITIIQGDSASGKTTLVEMIAEYLLNGSDTGISLTCDCKCCVVAGSTWQEQLNNISNSIVFIDEGNRFVSSEDFAGEVKASSNYFVIVTREAIDNLPYSVTEIYGIRSSGKFGSLEPVYHHMYRIYGDFDSINAVPDTVVAEDSNSGYDFFSGVIKERKAECISAGGSGNIFDMIQKFDSDKKVLIIADGAAFGSQMGKVYKLLLRRKDVHVYLPESFEWIVLSSGVIDDKEVRSILNNPSDFVDSSSYFSWERFFTDLLIRKSTGTWLQYSKTKLNPSYLQGKCKDKVLNVLPQVIKSLTDE